jgi:hypothetical protein
MRTCSGKIMRAARITADWLCRRQRNSSVELYVIADSLREYAVGAGSFEEALNRFMHGLAA